jgi:RNA-directed DNA polymerase
LGRLLDLDQAELAWFADVRGLERTVDEPLRHYRWHAVERRGGLRLLAEPKPRLKEAQRRLLRHVLAPVPVHDAAHGCVPGRSVRTAAAPHAGSAVVLGMDLEAFFASVAAPRIWGLLQGIAGLTGPVTHLVTALVTTTAPTSVWRALPVPVGADARERHRRLGTRLATPHLPQGAPTSPALANLVCFRLARRLAGLAATFGARYTRYVDDLTFSGDRRINGDRLAALVTEVAAEEGFRVNPAKTRVAGAGSRQRVLGAVVNTRPTLPRPERDALRALLHNCARHGWATQSRGHDPATFREHVLGRVAWAASLDPVFGKRLQAIAARIDWS